MPPPQELLLFCGASLLLILAPGPDLLFLIAQSIARGRAAGVATALGLAAGNLVHTLAAALGASVVFRTSAIAFQSLKVLGVLYLLYLAWRAFRNRKDLLAVTPDAGTSGGDGRALFWRGFLMNVLNPKVALFFLAFLPQFVTGDGSPIALQMVGLGLIFMGLVVVVFGAIGLAAGQVGRQLSRHPRVNEVMGWATASLFVALGVRLALTER